MFYIVNMLYQAVVKINSMTAICRIYKLYGKKLKSHNFTEEMRQGETFRNMRNQDYPGFSHFIHNEIILKDFFNQSW